MRWLFRLFVFGLDFLTLFPIALWRGLRGYVEPDRVQAAVEREAVQDEAALDAEREAILAQVEAAERRGRAPKVSLADIETRPSVPHERRAGEHQVDDYEAALELAASDGLSFTM